MHLLCTAGLNSFSRNSLTVPRGLSMNTESQATFPSFVPCSARKPVFGVNKALVLLIDGITCGLAASVYTNHHMHVHTFVAILSLHRETIFTYVSSRHMNEAKKYLTEGDIAQLPWHAECKSGSHWESQRRSSSFQRRQCQQMAKQSVGRCDYRGSREVRSLTSPECWSESTSDAHSGTVCHVTESPCSRHMKRLNK